MTYRAEYDEKRGWRVKADYRPDGGELMDVCGATDSMVATETALCLAALRKVRP